MLGDSCLEPNAIGLAPVGQRNALEKEELTGNLEWRQARGAMRAEARCRWPVLPGDDARHELLAAERVGSADDPDIRDTLRIAEDHLYLLRLHLAPGHVDERRYPAVQLQVSASVEPPKISRKEAAAHEG